MKTLNANRVLGALIAVLSLVYLYAAYQIPTFPIPRPIDSDAFPKVLGFVMIGLAVWLFFERPDDEDVAPALSAGEQFRRWLPVVVTATAIAIYAASLQTLGFVLASFLLVAGLTWFYGYRRHLVNAAVALAVPLVLYLVMTRLMTIHLPRGLLPF
jgi:putative tricarboxylic transport membrane protein